MQESTNFANAHNPISSLAGESVLILGGTSGIGLATAVAAKASGAAVTVAGRDRTRAAHLAQSHDFAASLAVEISDPQSIQQGLSTIERVDHLVMLAGSLILGKVLDAEIDALRRVYDERAPRSSPHFERSGASRSQCDAHARDADGFLPIF